MSKCGGSGGSKGNGAGKYSGGGDSSRGYERARGVIATLYPSDIFVSPIDKYALAKPGLSGMYKADTLQRYTPPKPHESDVFFGVDAFYRAVDLPHSRRMKRDSSDIPWKYPASAPDPLNDLENWRKRTQR